MSDPLTTRDRRNNSVVRGFRSFLFSCVLILSLTATAKIVSAFGHARILDIPDPIWVVSSRTLLFTVSGLETVVTGALLAHITPGTKCLLLAWLGGNFLLYRGASALLAGREFCPCLGTVTDAIGISHAAATYSLIAASCYLALGGLTFYVLHRRAGASNLCDAAPQAVIRRLAL